MHRLKATLICTFKFKTPEEWQLHLSVWWVLTSVLMEYGSLNHLLIDLEKSEIGNLQDRKEEII